MSNIIEILKNAPEYIGGTGRTDAEIESAEKQLGIEFALDYKRYLKEIGLACFDGHELTGICRATRLDVVSVTNDERRRCPNSTERYVVEQTGIDGIVIWQSSTGDVFQTIHGSRCRKISDSLEEYILQNIKV